MELPFTLHTLPLCRVHAATQQILFTTEHFLGECRKTRLFPLPITSVLGKEDILLHLKYPPEQGMGTHRITLEVNPKADPKPWKLGCAVSTFPPTQLNINTQA